MKQRFSERLLASKPVFQRSVGAFSIVIVAVWIWGLFLHRTMFENALISANILSIATACFFTVILYRGLKLRDNLGKPVEKFKWEGLPEQTDTGGSWFCMEGTGSGSLLEAVLSILISIVVLVLFYLLLLLFGNFIWAIILIVASIMYWVFFRAVRLVLKRAKKCKSNLWLSVLFGFGYTTFYAGLVYSFILISHFLL